MTQTGGKKGCRGQAAVLLCGVSSEARSTTYCSNRLPASMALLGEPLNRAGEGYDAATPERRRPREHLLAYGFNFQTLPGELASVVAERRDAGAGAHNPP